VSIRSTDDALAYVRTFTTDGRWALAGVREYAEPQIGKRPEPAYFRVERAVFQACCLVARSQEVANGFVVTRTVVNPQYEVLRLEEHIGRDGSWFVARSIKVSSAGRALGRWGDAPH
jgi:hypothetical protein